MVFNHTGEGIQNGPTISFRDTANPAYTDHFVETGDNVLFEATIKTDLRTIGV